MQNNFKELIKKISIFTTDPNKDWSRIFAILSGILVVAVIWSFAFYYKIQNDIQTLDRTQGFSGSRVPNKENELQSLISRMDQKKKQNNDIVSGNFEFSNIEMVDPAR